MNHRYRRTSWGDEAYVNRDNFEAMLTEEVDYIHPKLELVSSLYVSQLGHSGMFNGEVVKFKGELYRWLKGYSDNDRDTGVRK